MRKLFFLSLSVFLCAASPKPHMEKLPDLKKMTVDQLEGYRQHEDYLCNSERSSQKACDNIDSAWNEIKRRGYHWGPEKQPDGSSSAEAQKCWLAPGESDCGYN